MRRSAPTSVAIGTTLDVGASVTKNHAPRKPSVGNRISATAVSASSGTTRSAYGRTSPSVRATGQP